MTTQNNNLTLKILIGVLGALLLILGIFTYKFYNEEKENKAILQKEKDLIESELGELITKYDNAIALNEVMDDHLLKAKERIVVLLDSVEKNEANLALISRYRREVGKLKKERERLFKLADSLTVANTQLATDLDSTSVALNQRIIFSDSLQTQNSRLAEIVERGSALTAANIKAEGVRVRNSGKISTTPRASKADKVRVCFTLSPNKLTEKGDKELFVQVINPENNLIGDKISVNFDDAILTYSGRNKVFYENDELDVCVLVDAAEGELVKGNYVVNLFSGPRMISNTQFELK
ncbi:hypothetical protein D1816_17620 [Aquimarina sp. AD10]|uniref:Chromosome partitioning protein ParA n=1 Tax=Aquimarina aggregata TaxID=1642818 RepID=A0A162ZHF5_9FLAO|nr:MULTISPECIES: hypothetical protein [Aquimarina]AXT62099.1 hypothetical protein D1816_17620 [Aquimarina sp. AD10]KZS39799.1 hypothetical protein AWE51_09115 [Aquimarina aggregata]RKM99913.1 hypothetical protein D7033_09960 [Aquimarina sp. AD10]